MTIFARNPAIGGVAAAALALSLIGSGGQAAAQSERQLAPPPPITKRVEALENKTDYYNKKEKKFHIVRNKSGAVALNGEASPKSIGCRPNRPGVGNLQVRINPNLAFGGISYAWLRFTANFPAGSKNEFVILYAVDGGGNNSEGCGVLKKTPGDLFTGKKFCSLDVERDYTFLVEFYAEDNAGEVKNTCAMDVDVELKLTNIEVVEPE